MYTRSKSTMISMTVLFVVFTMILNVVASQSAQERDYEFDLADLAVDYTTNDGMVHLEAFSLKGNKVIMDTEDQNKYSQLTWLSLGVPQLVALKSRNTTSSLIFTPEGFSILVGMLTLEHKKKIIQEVQRKYKIEVSYEQIVSLVPSTFQCFISFNQNNIKVSIPGVTKNMNTFPLRVDFVAAEGSKERILFKQRQEKLDLAFECEFIVNAKGSKTNTLSISGAQLNSLGITDELFGPNDAVYVTRDQMSNLASELYVKLKIVEEYEMPQSQFSDIFITNILNTAAEKVTTSVPFDEVLKSLSPYSFNKKDLDPDVIKKEMSKIFKVESTGSKERIVLNQDHYNHLRTASERSTSGGGSARGSFLFGLLKGRGSVSVNHFTKESKDSAQHDKTLNDQLKELNQITESNVEWEREGEKIVPKSLKVSRIIKSKFSQTLNFDRIKREYYDTLYNKNFILYTTKLNVQATIDHLQQFKDELGTKISQLEKKFEDELGTKISQLEKKFKDVYTEVNKFKSFGDVVPLYRYTNGYDHFYTTHAHEIGTTTTGQTGLYNYMSEGIQCHVFSKHN